MPTEPIIGLIGAGAIARSHVDAYRRARGHRHRGWQIDPARSGGHLVHNGVHAFDLACWLLGERPRRVHAHGRAAAHPCMPTADYWQAVLERGVFASITVGRLAAGPGDYSIRVHGSHASMLVDEERPRVSVYGASGQRTRAADGSAGEQALRGLIDDFVNAIDTGGSPLCGIHDGVALAAVLEPAYASAACGQPCTVAA